MRLPRTIEATRALLSTGEVQSSRALNINHICTTRFAKIEEEGPAQGSTLNTNFLVTSPVTPACVAWQASSTLPLQTRRKRRVGV